MKQCFRGDGTGGFLFLRIYADSRGLPCPFNADFFQRVNQDIRLFSGSGMVQLFCEEGSDRSAAARSHCSQNRNLLVAPEIGQFHQDFDGLIIGDFSKGRRSGLDDVELCFLSAQNRFKDRYGPGIPVATDGF